MEIDPEAKDSNGMTGLGAMLPGGGAGGGMEGMTEEMQE